LTPPPLSNKIPGYATVKKGMEIGTVTTEQHNK